MTKEPCPVMKVFANRLWLAHGHQRVAQRILALGRDASGRDGPYDPTTPYMVGCGLRARFLTWKAVTVFSASIAEKHGAQALARVLATQEYNPRGNRLLPELTGASEPLHPDLRWALHSAGQANACVTCVYTAAARHAAEAALFCEPGIVLAVAEECSKVHRPAP
jgi:hypothetical protein